MAWMFWLAIMQATTAQKDSADHEEPARGELVFSVKFSLAASMTPIADEFLKLVKKHNYFRNCWIYFPKEELLQGLPI